MKIRKNTTPSRKKPKAVNLRWWAYFSPDGFVQMRSIAATKQDSWDLLVKFHENAGHKYKALGYYVARVDVSITPVATTPTLKRKR